MSADEMQPSNGEQAGGESPLPVKKRRRSFAWHLTRAGAWGLGGALALVILLLSGLTWYTTTGDFQRRVKREIVSVLEDTTGGRVELQGVHFSLWRLRINVDGLVIHGLEGPDERPIFLRRRSRCGSGFRASSRTRWDLACGRMWG
jgi:hypothetical protein